MPGGMTQVTTPMIALACGLAAVHLGWLLYLAFAWRRWIADRLGSAVATVHRRIKGTNSEDELDGEVTKRLHARTLEIIQRGASLASLMYLALILLFLFAVVPSGHPISLFHFLANCFTYVCMLVLSAGVWKPSPNQIMAWYSLVMAVQCLHVGPFFEHPTIYPVDGLGKVTAAFVSIVSMQRHAAIFWLGVYFLVAQVGVRDNGDNPAVSIGWFFWLSFTGLISQLMEGRVRGQLREQIQSEMLQERQAAITVLLNTLYDAVVELDCELQIVGQVEQLARFLSCSRGSLEGRRFPEFLPDEEDRGLVSTRIPECLGGRRSIAEVMNLRMCTEDGRLLQVEAFCIYYRCLGGRAQYLLGLREFGEATAVASTELRGSGTAESQGHDAMALPEDVRVTIATSDESLPILERSAGFRHLMGGKPTQASLLEFMDAPSVFVKWLHMSVNNALWDYELSETAAPRSLDVALRAHAGRPGRLIHATCRVDAVRTAGAADGESEEAHSEPGLPLVVSLAFGDLRHGAVDRATGSSSGSSSGGERSRHGRRVGQGTQRRPDQRHVGSLNEPSTGEHLFGL